MLKWCVWQSEILTLTKEYENILKIPEIAELKARLQFLEVSPSMYPWQSKNTMIKKLEFIQTFRYIGGI